MCGQNIHIIIADPETKRVVQFCSMPEFTIREAAMTLKSCDIKLYEKFSNADYSTIETQDFRQLRYKKNELYARDMDSISDISVVNKNTKE
jgi:hypothetical protein